MDRTTTPEIPAAPLAFVTRPPAVSRLYAVEGLCSIGGNLMQVGIFFYTNRRFGWGLRENFTLAATQGVVYVVGALLANRLATRVAPRRALAGVCAVLTLIALTPLATDSPSAMVAAVLAYTATIGLCWPILESLVSTGVDPHLMSRRISIYNVVWAGTGAATLAVNGTIIEFWPAGVFVITALVHGTSAVIMLKSAPPRRGETGEVPAHAPHPAHADPEPELLRVRTLALWLSRISMPASYALIYALSALLPSLPSMQRLPTWAATLVGSTWLAARWLTFVVLWLDDWWHTRPRALMAAAWLMLAGFAGAASQPVASAGPDALRLNLAWLILCQVVIGISIGLIYSASLYFGMVLSEGSTEHSGYHEALIGLGSVLGPGAGAVAQWARPGETTLGVLAVAGVLMLSTLLATGASVVAERKRE
jgi:MFS family permease